MFFLFLLLFFLREVFPPFLAPSPPPFFEICPHCMFPLVLFDLMCLSFLSCAKKRFSFLDLQQN